MALIENPLGFISGLMHEHNLDKYAKLILAMAVAGFCAFFGAFGTVSSGAYYAGVTDWRICMLLGLANGSLAMSASVWATWAKNKPKGVELVLPEGVQERGSGQPSGQPLPHVQKDAL